MSKFRSANVVGLGYIGLPTAAILAVNGIKVHGTDVNESVVDQVSRGVVPFVEPDLGGFLTQAVAAGMLTASTSVEPADAYILAVPTPFHDDLSPDLTYVQAASEAVAPVLQSGALVIL